MGSFDLVSAWPSEKRARKISAIVIVLGVVYLCVPRFNGWTMEHLHKEDGLIFLTDFLRDGWTGIFRTYTGYLHVGPRLVTGACQAFPADAFAGCVGVSMAIFRGMLTAVALAVFLPYAKSWKWALTAAAVILFAGVGQQEVLGNLTNMRWFTDVACLLVLLGNFRKALPALAIAVLAVVSVLSDPLALILAPLALWRLITLRGWSRAVPTAFIVASALHIASMDSSARSMDWEFLARNPVSFFTQALVRGPLEALIGQTGTQVAINLIGPYFSLLGLLLPLAVVLLAWRHARPATLSLVSVMVVASMATLCATLLFAPLEVITLTKAGTVGMGSRYALLPATIFSQSLLLLVPWAITTGVVGRVVGWALVGLMVAASAVDSRGDYWNTHGPRWTETISQVRHECKVKGMDEITVPITPQGVPKQWTATITCSWILR